MKGWQEAGGRVETGTRTELIERLNGIALGCLGSDGYRAEAYAAALALATGDAGAGAGHTWYRVVEPDS